MLPQVHSKLSFNSITPNVYTNLKNIFPKSNKVFNHKLNLYRSSYFINYFVNIFIAAKLIKSMFQSSLPTHKHMKKWK